MTGLDAAISISNKSTVLKFILTRTLVFIKRIFKTIKVKMMVDFVEIS